MNKNRMELCLFITKFVGETLSKILEPLDIQFVCILAIPDHENNSFMLNQASSLDKEKSDRLLEMSIGGNYKHSEVLALKEEQIQ